MWSKELSSHASLEVLSHARLGRLGCVRGMQPYVVPVEFAYHDHSLYSFSLPGQKIDWMRANPLVCVEADQMRREFWATVVIFGRYEELIDAPEYREARALAVNVLQQKAMWWERGSAKTMTGAAQPMAPIFYRIRVEQITGRCGASDPAEGGATQAKTAADEPAWLRKLVDRARAG